MASSVDIFENSLLWKLTFELNIDKWDNPLYIDDCIYAPNITVFKSDTNFPKPLAPDD